MTAAAQKQAPEAQDSLAVLDLLHAYGIKIEIGSDGKKRIYAKEPVAVQIYDMNGQLYSSAAPSAIVVAPANDNLASIIDFSKLIGREVDTNNQDEKMVYLGRCDQRHWAGMPAKMIKVFDWNDGEKHVKNLRYGGFKDWKQPLLDPDNSNDETKDLTRLMFKHKGTLLKDTNGRLPDNYNCLWSGTPYDTYHAWYRDFDCGVKGWDSRSLKLSVWPVRSLDDAQLKKFLEKQNG